MIIIITGKARAGKDTSAEFIAETMREKARKEGRGLSDYYISFADPLKSFCVNILGLNRRQCYGNTEDKKSLTHIKWADVPISNEIKEKYRKDNNSDATFLSAREVMEIFGSYICRAMYPDCWARSAAIECATIAANSPLSQIFITDCRFPNEVEAFKDQNPIIIKLHRNPQNRQAVSETALDNFDWSGYKIAHIHNEHATIEERNEMLLQAMKELNLI